MKRKQFRSMFILLLVFVIATSVSVTAKNIFGNTGIEQKSLLSEYLTKVDPTIIGSNLKEKKEKRKNVIVATINGQSIYGNQVDIKKYLNETSYNLVYKNFDDNGEMLKSLIKTDEETIKEIAKIIVMENELNKREIFITDEDALKSLHERETNRQKLIEMGNKDTIESEKRDILLYESIGLNKQDYINTFGIELEKETLIISRFSSIYCEELIDKRKRDKNSEIISFDDYLESLLNEADFKIATVSQ